MRKFTTPFILIPTAAFAAAPLADSFYNHRHWIFPAYAYCLVFGLIIMFGLFLATIVWKSKTKTLTEMISQYSSNIGYWQLYLPASFWQYPLE